MPRGNLEAVAPRMLVLAAIADALQARAYAAAWELATTNRVSVRVGAVRMRVGAVSVRVGAVSVSVRVGGVKHECEGGRCECQGARVSVKMGAVSVCVRVVAVRVRVGAGDYTQGDFEGAVLFEDDIRQLHTQGKAHAWFQNEPFRDALWEAAK
eukprot:1157626-Pelagomonas_calceolata.AAC.16